MRSTECTSSSIYQETVIENSLKKCAKSRINNIRHKQLKYSVLCIVASQQNW